MMERPLMKRVGNLLAYFSCDYIIPQQNQPRRLRDPLKVPLPLRLALMQLVQEFVLIQSMIENFEYLIVEIHIFLLTSDNDEQGFHKKKIKINLLLLIY